MATVKIILRKNHVNSNGKAPLRIRMLYKDQIKEITIPGVRVEPHLWDPISQKVKGDKLLNLRIQNKASEYRTAINKAMVINDTIHLDQIHNMVLGELDSYPTKKVSEYLESTILNDMRLSLGTRKYYKSLYNIIKTEYAELKLDQVNGAFLTRFSDELTRKGLKMWTCHNRLKCLKRTINRAYEDKLIKHPDWRGFKNIKGRSRKECLTSSELSNLKILLHEVPGDSLDHRILRAFLFSCYCSAMRFGDLAMLSYENISFRTEGRINLSYTMRKTNKHIHIPLNKVAAELIDVNKIGLKEMVFGLVPYSLMIQEQDAISRKISSRNAYCNKRLKIYVKKACISKKISFHCARITFCSIAISLGISRFLITEIAGLTLKVLEDHYAKYFDDSKAQALDLFDTL